MTGHPSARPLDSLRVAAILDDFTSRGLGPECSLLPLSLDNWMSELGSFAPDLLFVESAWWGHRKQWHGKISHAAPVLGQLLAWCKEHHIPSVFWGKEDPVHYDRFLAAASMFDSVFTSDIDCVARYKQALGHDRVYVLPFACQPREYHPVERDERAVAACFAGAYYVRYPERTRDLRTLVDSVQALMPVTIFDRYLGSGDHNYAFPDAYRQLIQGSLPAHAVAEAGKRYRYAINLNTVKRSGSMCARRVCELLGSGTTVVSNDCLGVRRLFGELVICSDDGQAVSRQLASLVGDEAARARRTVAGVRKVMQEHTYARRLASIASCALRRPLVVPVSSVLLVGYAASPAQRDAILQSALRQQHQPWRLLLIMGPGVAGGAAASSDARIRTLAHAELGEHAIGTLAPSGFACAWIAPLVAQDYYGAHYLTDLLLAASYSNAEAFCKRAHFGVVNGEIVQNSMECAYRACSAVALRSAVVRRRWLDGQAAARWIRDCAGMSVALDGLAIDPYNYCRDADLLDPAHCAASLAQHVDDLLLDKGLVIEELERQAMAISALAQAASRVPYLPASKLAAWFDPWGGSQTSAELDRFGWHLVSELQDGQSEEVFARLPVGAAQLRALGVWRFFLEAGSGLPVHLLVACIDVHGATLRQDAFSCNVDEELILPFGTRMLRLGLRMQSSGSTRLHRLWLGWRPQ
ncbi:CgeB family protein [Massilia genomosp. 1]|nr:glycosyltransferase [Massilia genomosp. 1]